MGGGKELLFAEDKKLIKGLLLVASGQPHSPHSQACLLCWGFRKVAAECCACGDGAVNHGWHTLLVERYSPKLDRQL